MSTTLRASVVHTLLVQQILLAVVVAHADLVRALHALSIGALHVQSLRTTIQVDVTLGTTLALSVQTSARRAAVGVVDTGHGELGHHQDEEEDGQVLHVRLLLLLLFVTGNKKRDSSLVFWIESSRGLYSRRRQGPMRMSIETLCAQCYLERQSRVSSAMLPRERSKVLSIMLPREVTKSIVGNVTSRAI